MTIPRQYAFDEREKLQIVENIMECDPAYKAAKETKKYKKMLKIAEKEEIRAREENEFYKHAYRNS